MMILRHILSILLLPFTVTILVPAALQGDFDVSWTAAPVSGAVAIALGLALVVQTVAAFAVRGRGTLAPWDPPQRLVVTGIYRHVRNPMISGVLLVLVGESLVLSSVAIGAWAAIVLVVNAIYIPLHEEPDLVRRFGDEYEAYRRNVPRWIPRVSPWTPTDPA